MEPKEKTTLIFKALDELSIITYLPTPKEKLSVYESVQIILSDYPSTGTNDTICLNKVKKLITKPTAQNHFLDELAKFVSAQLEKVLTGLL